MSIVCCLSTGWLLDHLSFINKPGYQIFQSCDHCGKASFDDPQTAALDNDLFAAGFSDPCRKDFVSQHGATGRKDEMLKETFVFREEFFNVFKPHITSNFQRQPQQRNSALEDGGSHSKKRKRSISELNHGERDAFEYHLKISGMILNGTTSLVQEALKNGFLQPISTQQIDLKTPSMGLNDCALAELCEMAKRIPPVNEGEQKAMCMINEDASIPEQVHLTCVTENTTDYARIITLMGHKYLFPPQSSFLLSDISYMKPLLDYKKKFGIIVIDPPWENKSVKRSNRYCHLPPWQIKQIPVPALAAPDCLVVTWVTNRQKHLRFVKNELYPHWNVHGVVEWYWVKITRSGEFVFPLDSSHKKPYEVLLLGRVQGNTDVPLSRISEDEILPIPDHKLIVSVPCTLHSHKPPLTEILKEYTRPGVECLELFARNLQPGWTSWGNEVLKFQHMDYFIRLQNEK